jgi:hypothetical protein
MQAYQSSTINAPQNELHDVTNSPAQPAERVEGCLWQELVPEHGRSAYHGFMTQGRLSDWQ